MSPDFTVAKVALVIGTRPELIKMLPLVRQLKATVVLSGQHPDLRFLLPFGVEVVCCEPWVTATNTARLCEAMSALNLALKPFSHIIVHGDTTTAVAASLVAHTQKKQLAHVEAGLRTYNAQHPHPEEGNRRLIDAITHLHLPPTDTAKKNLLTEGQMCDFEPSGNTGIDSLRRTISRLQITKPRKDFALCTLHRQEAMPHLFEICERIVALSEQLPVLFILHPNPNTAKKVRALLTGRGQIRLINSLPHEHFIEHLLGAKVLVTDSGGAQEEAAALGVPCLVLREVTDRPEAVEHNVAAVVGFTGGPLLAALADLAATPCNCFGFGAATESVAQALNQWFFQ